MSDEGKPLSADHVFKKIFWRQTVSLSHTMEQAATWTITGIAAIVGLFISNLDSVERVEGDVVKLVNFVLFLE